MTQQSSHIYHGNFDSTWTIGSVPHGGYVTSCIQQVASLHFATTQKKQNQPHTITLHLEFLRRTEVGPATFTVKDVKLGRATSTIHITLSQEIEGHIREEVVGYITQSNLHTESGPTYSTGWNLQPTPAPANTANFPDKDPNWRELQVRPFASFRKAMKQVRFMLPSSGQHVQSANDEWMCFTDPTERFTNESLGFVCDMFTQLVESHLEVEAGASWDQTGAEKQEERRKKAAYWYPTVLLNLDVKKALPAEGVKWLFVRVRAKQIKNGRYDLEVIIMDEAGDLVALSHHVCLILDASRNLAKRKGGDGQASKEAKL